MSGFLLDTNVISELMKPRGAPQVIQWVSSIPESLLYLSAITIGEIRRGIDLLPEESVKRTALQSWLDRDVRLRFHGRLLPFGDDVAERWGHLDAIAKKRKLSIPTIDAMLAATALHHGLTFVTRNVKEIEETGVSYFDPWRNE